jgi:hypothetical protein
MTPAEWFAAITPEPLLAPLRPEPPTEPPPRLSRRFRLFACACARMVWDLLPTDARSAVLTSERFADGRATVTDLWATAVRENYPVTGPAQLALVAAYSACAGDGLSLPAAMGPSRALVAQTYAAACAARALADVACGAAGASLRFPTAPEHPPGWDDAFAEARLTQTGFVRDIFPPPEYSPAISPDCLTPTVRGIAQQMEASGDFSAAPILADALQDAGCDDDAALQCCRAPGNVHVRGNWVVDLVLGRG